MIFNWQENDNNLVDIQNSIHWTGGAAFVIQFITKLFILVKRKTFFKLCRRN
jgi:hypothetical protein